MKKKIVLFLTLILAFTFLLTPKTNAAVPKLCDPTNVSIDKTNNYNTSVTFGNQFDHQPDGEKMDFVISSLGINASSTVQNQSVTFTIGKVVPGQYPFSIFIVDQFGNHIFCGGSEPAYLNVPDVGQGGSTVTTKGTIEYSPTSPGPSDKIEITAKNLPDDAIYFISVTQYTNPLNFYQCLRSTDKQLSTTVGPLVQGAWTVYVTKNQDQQNINNCHSGSTDPFFAKGTITITTPDATSTPTPPPAPCPGGFCQTALGNINTDPVGFVKSLFVILLSLSGGVAIALIMISGYRLMASGGNPEKVQAAREQLTSAIVGLLFIIFSMTILQIIGVSILHIPGFQ